MKRLFIAIDLQDQAELIRHLLDSLRQAGVRGRSVRRDHLHLTLQFLGDVPESALENLRYVLNQTAGQIAPFQLTLSGLGTFGKHSDLIWLGVAENAVCRQLHRILTRSLCERGLPHENRPFQPHVTLIRQAVFPAESPPDRLIQTIRQTPIDVPVHQIHLMESRLDQGRRRYVPLFTVPLLVADNVSC